MAALKGSVLTPVDPKTHCVQCREPLKVSFGMGKIDLTYGKVDTTKRECNRCSRVTLDPIPAFRDSSYRTEEELLAAGTAK